MFSPVPRGQATFCICTELLTDEWAVVSCVAMDDVHIIRVAACGAASVLPWVALGVQWRRSELWGRGRAWGDAVMRSGAGLILL